MKRLFTILLWSSISAAFIGPGTVTCTAAAGAGFGYSLLFALVFSVLCCIVLQEASARLTIVTGKPLSRVLAEELTIPILPALIVGAVILGCAAYQAGNILGAAAGASLRIRLSPRWITLITGLIAGAVLFAGTAKTVARILGVGVAIMGAAFLACAVQLKPDLAPLVRGCLVPAFPKGSGLLILSLVGTTVVPYNLFLGSGLAKGQTLSEARLGLYVAIPLGGLISMAILVTGTALEGSFSFEALEQCLNRHLGDWAGLVFACGLFLAGLSSAITAPLAAGLSLRDFLEKNGSDRTTAYRVVWSAVLLFGLAFGLAEVKPIPVILLAQAANGILLPLIALFLWIMVNNRRCMGHRNLLGPLANVLLGCAVLLTFLLGASGLLRAVFACLSLPVPNESVLLTFASISAAALAWPTWKALARARRKDLP